MVICYVHDMCLRVLWGEICCAPLICYTKQFTAQLQLHRYHIVITMYTTYHVHTILPSYVHTHDTTYMLHKTTYSTFKITSLSCCNDHAHNIIPSYFHTHGTRTCYVYICYASDALCIYVTCKILHSHQSCVSCFLH